MSRSLTARDHDEDVRDCPLRGAADHHHDHQKVAQAGQHDDEAVESDERVHDLLGKRLGQKVPLAPPGKGATCWGESRSCSCSTCADPHRGWYCPSTHFHQGKQPYSLVNSQRILANILYVFCVTVVPPGWAR